MKLKDFHGADWIETNPETGIDNVRINDSNFDDDIISVRFREEFNTLYLHTKNRYNAGFVDFPVCSVYVILEESL